MQTLPFWQSRARGQEAIEPGSLSRNASEATFSEIGKLDATDFQGRLPHLSHGSVHREDYEAFTQEQLQLVCRLALAEEQLLTSVNSLHQSTKLEQQGHPVRRREVLEGIEGAHSAVGEVYDEIRRSCGRLRQMTLHAATTEPAPEHSEGLLFGSSLSSAEEPECTGPSSIKSSQRSKLHQHLRDFHKECEMERYEQVQLRSELQAFKSNVVVQLRALANELASVSCDIKRWEQKQSSPRDSRKWRRDEVFDEDICDMSSSVSDLIREEVRKQVESHFDVHQSTMEHSIDALEQMILEQDKRTIELNTHMQRHVGLLVEERKQNVQREEFDKSINSIWRKITQVECQRVPSITSPVQIRDPMMATRASSHSHSPARNSLHATTRSVLSASDSRLASPDVHFSSAAARVRSSSLKAVPISRETSTPRRQAASNSRAAVRRESTPRPTIAGISGVNTEPSYTGPMAPSARPASTPRSRIACYQSSLMAHMGMPPSPGVTYAAPRSPSQGARIVQQSSTSRLLPS